MLNGELLTHWTIRLALVCYMAVLAGTLAGMLTGRGSRWAAAARGVWTAGCLLFVIHAGCAFHFYHDWSHRQAFGHTAEETRALLGWEFGAGIYFSYFFAAVWIFDVAWWWRGIETYCGRPRWVTALIHGYLLFIAFNGAIIFESGPTRWAGIVVCAVAAPFSLLVRSKGCFASTKRGNPSERGGACRPRPLLFPGTGAAKDTAPVRSLSSTVKHLPERPTQKP